MNIPQFSTAFMGMRSSVNDLPSFAAAVMERYDLEKGIKHEQKVSTPAKKSSENPLKGVAELWNRWWTRPHDDGFDNETAHTMGWVRTRMPSSALGSTSYNRGRQAEDIIGKDSQPRWVYGHSGLSNGAVATFYVLPESHSAVVVMSNAADAGDASETASQILLQALFDLQPKVDLIKALKGSQEHASKEHQKMVDDWKKNRDPSQFSAKTEELIGTYLGMGGASSIHIIRSEQATSGLALIFGDEEVTQCELDPYGADALGYLPLEREETLAKGMMDWDYWTVGVVQFVRKTEGDKNSPVVGFRWKWDEFDYAGLWVKTEDATSEQDYEAIVAEYGRYLPDSCQSGPNSS